MKEFKDFYQQLQNPPVSFNIYFSRSFECRAVRGNFMKFVNYGESDFSEKNKENYDSTKQEIHMFNQISSQKKKKN